MTYKDGFTRAVATFIAGAASAPIPAAIFNWASWKVVVAAGITAVINLVVRWAQAYLAPTKVS